MCGFAGIFYFDQRQEVNVDDLKRATKALAHRGPDDEGIYTSGGLGIGHRRLAIIGSNPSSKQPLLSPDENLVLVCNGEIYNFPELRQELSTKGYEFRTDSDSEIILHLYQEEGEGLVQHLRGMFAFALYDKKRNKLLLARDRLGVKPLKYSFFPGGIAFASELKALFNFKEVTKTPDISAIAHLLSLQFVPAPQTGFKNIHKLPPAHILAIKGCKESLKRYWNPKFVADYSFSFADHCRELQDVINEAVRIRLTSNRPLGAFISGGIDSALVAGSAARHLETKLPTFSLGFPESGYDETIYAEEVARRINSQHSSFYADQHLPEMFAEIIHHYEEPYADSSALPTYLLMKMSRPSITVALCGDGGDENFGGYERYLLFKYILLFPRLFEAMAPRLLSTLPNAFRRRLAEVINESRSQSPEAKYLNFFAFSFFTEKEKGKLLTPEFQCLCEGQSTGEMMSSRLDFSVDALNGVFRFDLENYLAEDLLPKMDMAASAWGMEVRSPLLDHRVVEAAARVPDEYKIRRGRTKYILRQAFAAELPAKTISRGKMGFRAPVDVWLRQKGHPFKSFAWRNLLEAGLIQRGICRREALERLWQEHEKGLYFHGNRLYALLALEFWLQAYFPDFCV